MHTPKKNQKYYIRLNYKFWLSQLIAVAWLILSIYFSIPWLKDLTEYTSLPFAIFAICGIAYVPGYISVFNISGLLFDRQPPYIKRRNINEVTVLVACHNEEKSIANTLGYIAKQDFKGHIKVFVIDNASTDRTFDVAKEAGKELSLDITVLKESVPGKNFALNTALNFVKTDYLITLDADTLLHNSAVRFLMKRMESGSEEVVAVAGAVLVQNSRFNFLAKLQEWDYFLGIASIKRLQGVYQGTLVAQGAYSLYETRVIQEMGGWPDAIGEDIVITWGMLSKGYKVLFEPHAIAFTEVPTKFVHLFRQRSRWSRGMIEALKITKPWQQPSPYVRYLTGINLVMPYLDVVFTLVFIPGLILALFGNFIIVGPLTLLLLPLALLQNYILYRYQKGVFEKFGLRIRKNILGLFIYVLFYQVIMSPMSLWGYVQELVSLKRVWK